MEKKRKQTSLDTFFTRSRVIKSSDGTLRTERLITEKVEFQTIDPTMLTVPPKRFPCGVRGCGNFFGNEGTLQTHTLIKHQGQRPVGQSGINFGNGASAQKFPVPFWKVCAAFVVAGICWRSDMDMDCASFTPWYFSDQKNKQRKNKFQMDANQRYSILKKAEYVQMYLVWHFLFAPSPKKSPHYAFLVSCLSLNKYCILVRFHNRCIFQQKLHKTIHFRVMDAM